MDTIVGKRNGKESVILTLIERKTRCQLLRLIEGRDADSVSYALRGIKREWGACIKTITADNGPEFTALNTAFAGTETEIFYAHPYTSCDRGTNEARNRMIRQDFPKGMSLDDISPSQVQATQDRLNQLPRKQQGYCTPQQNFEAEARRVRRMAQ
ncbi:IS30 family transposase [Loigolactobacillus backii]